MPKALPDIIYDKNNVTPIIDAQTSFYKILMYKDDEYNLSSLNLSNCGEFLV